MIFFIPTSSILGCIEAREEGSKGKQRRVARSVKVHRYPPERRSATCHSSSCSASGAPTIRISESRVGKIGGRQVLDQLGLPPRSDDQGGDTGFFQQIRQGDLRDATTLFLGDVD